MDKQPMDEATRLEAVEKQLWSLEKRIEGVSKMIDILNYMRSVQNAFQNQIEKCTQFHQILDEFIEDRIALDDVMKQIKVLFRGHKDLLAGSFKFLFSYYQLKHSVDHMSALNFLRKVRERFGCESTEYITFLEIMKSFGDNNTTYEEVYSTAFRLFQGQEDLLQDLRKIMPRLR